MRRARTYQINALRWSDTLGHCSFFIDMRMGKCLIAIRRVKRWKIDGPILIITPYSAFDGWQTELPKENETEAIELTGTREERKQKLISGLEDGRKWFMINVEGHRALPEITGISWSVVIADESRFLHNPRTDQSKFYINGFDTVPHKICLSGTPDYHNKLDFYQQLYFLDRRLLPYKNYWDFRAKAFHACGYDFIIKKSQLTILEKVMAKNCLFLRRKDVKLGRKKIYRRRLLSLPRKLRPIYKSLEDEYVLEGNPTEKTIYAVRAYTWMMRLCGGFLNEEYTWLGKVEEIKWLLKNELNNEQIVIGCRFKKEIDMLTELLNTDAELIKARISAVHVHGDLTRKKRRENLNAFRIGRYKILIAQHSIIAHGVDLKNATAIIHYSQPMGEEIRDQFDDRIITMSDEETVLIIDLLVKDTVDLDTRLSHIIHDGERGMFERTIKRRQANGIS